MDRDVADRLIELDLAYTRNEGVNGYILAAPRPIIALYMTILARKISESTKAPLITDRPTYARLANEVIGGSVAQDVPEASNVIQHLLVDFIHPQSVSALSMTDILRLRCKLLPSMKRFRVELESAVTELSMTTDATAYEQRVRDTRARIHDALGTHRDKCKLSGLEFVQKSLGISGLSSLPAIAGVAGHVLAPPVIGASMGVAFFLQTLIYHQQFKAANDTCAYQYVLSLEKKFA